MTKMIKVTCDEEGIVYHKEYSFWRFLTAIRVSRDHGDHGHETTMTLYDTEGKFVGEDE